MNKKSGGFCLRNLLCLFACLALIGYAGAFDGMDIEIQDNVYLVGEVFVPVRIENNSLQEKDLSVEFVAPSFLYFEMENIPEKIPSMGSENFSIFMSPTIEMEGTTYNAKLIVTLGNETVMKDVKIHMQNIPREIPNEKKQEEKQENLQAGFFGLNFSDPETAITYFLIAIVIVLVALFFVKLVSSPKRKEVFY